MNASKSDIFLAKITVQIKDSRGSRIVRKEIKGHLEDRVEDFMSEGFSSEEAELKAIEAFGDPKEIGKEFDKLYNRWTRRIRNLIVFIILFQCLFYIGPTIREWYILEIGGNLTSMNDFIDENVAKIGLKDARSYQGVSFRVGNTEVFLERVISLENDTVYVIVRHKRVNFFNVYGPDVMANMDLVYDQELARFSSFIIDEYDSSAGALQWKGVDPYWVAVMEHTSEIPDTITIAYKDMNRDKTFEFDLDGGVQ